MTRKRKTTGTIAERFGDARVGVVVCLGDVDVKIGVGSFNYSNALSQGALIKATDGFPQHIPYHSKRRYFVADGYLDRIREYARAVYNEAMQPVTGDFAAWAHSSSDVELREFARVLFSGREQPLHVMAVYYYDVSTGYPCPYVMALFESSPTGVGCGAAVQDRGGSN